MTKSEAESWLTGLGIDVGSVDVNAVLATLGKTIVDDAPVEESNDESVAETECVQCGTTFSFRLKRGRRPRLCSHECKKAHRNEKIRASREPSVRMYNCITCGVECSQTGLGPGRKYCADCNPRNRSRVRTFTCDVCGKEGQQTTRGTARKRCITCKPEVEREAVVRTFTCEVCNEPGVQTGKGPTRKRHEHCKPKLDGKVRTYTCIDCGKVNQQFGRGRLRVRCVECKPDLSVVKPQKDEHTQKAIEIMNALGIEGAL